MTSEMRVLGRFGGAALGIIVVSGTAFAQDAAVPEGTVVKIKAVSPEDAYFEGRKPMIGLICGVEAGGLEQQGKSPKWFGGSLKCDNGESYYFYKVKVEVGDYGVDYETLTGHPVGVALPSSDDDTEDDYGAVASPWPTGSRVRIADLSTEDAHINDKGTLVGQACTVTDADLSSSGGAWYSGELTCERSGELYFYKVAVSADTAPVTTGAAAGAGVATGAGESEFGAGKMVKIVDVAAADALYASRATLVGRTCSVVEAPLSPTGEGWYAGRLFCDDGKSYQAFKVKVAAP